MKRWCRSANESCAPLTKLSSRCNQSGRRAAASPPPPPLIGRYSRRMSPTTCFQEHNATQDMLRKRLDAATRKLCNANSGDPVAPGPPETTPERAVPTSGDRPSRDPLNAQSAATQPPPGAVTGPPLVAPPLTTRELTASQRASTSTARGSSTTVNHQARQRRRSSPRTGGGSVVMKQQQESRGGSRKQAPRSRARRRSRKR